MKLNRLTVIYFILALLPLVAAALVFSRVPESVSVVEGITVATGRGKIFLLPVINVVLGLGLFVLFERLKAAYDKRDEQEARASDASATAEGLKIYIILFLDVLCFCSVYGYYALDWGGTATAVLMCRGASLALGVGGVLLGRILPKCTRRSLIALRWGYTLKSDNVWHYTHRLGKWLFYFGGAFSILCSIIYKSMEAVFICLICYALVMLVLYYYSYRLYYNEFHK